MLKQTLRARASWLGEVQEAHAALHQYGLHRLEPVGWRELGIGALVASGPAFRFFALDAAADWAAIELRGPSGETFAEAAQRPSGFAPQLHRALGALGRSRLALFRVAPQHGEQPRLLDLRTRVHVAIAGLVRPHLVLPEGATVVARLVASPSAQGMIGALLVSSTVVDAASVPGGDASRALLRHLLATAATLDAAEEALVLEPRLLGVRPDVLAQLDRAMRALQRVLVRERRTVAWPVEHGELVAEQHGVGWRVSLRGEHHAAVEGVPAAVAHPFDVEMMRQIGVEHYVWEAEGDIAALTRACSHSSTRSRSAA